MSLRVSAIVTLVFLLAPLANPKDKHKNILPEYVLTARTVAVIEDPYAKVPLLNPAENRVAQQDVEKALMKWGRFTPVIDISTADLVIAVRKGRMVNPTVGGGAATDRPVIIQPGEGGIRIGAQRGNPPPATSGQSQDPSPRPGMEIGPSDDMLEVYRGGVEYPLDGSAVWRYLGHNALRPPTVPAVTAFRKAIEDAEKQKKHKP